MTTRLKASYLCWCLMACSWGGIIGSVQAEILEGGGLVRALRNGGFVLVMRHASSPSTLPDKSSADPENTSGERQLDHDGRLSAEAMGLALRRLRIPVGHVFSSPAYRARETARLAALEGTQSVAELDVGPQGMALEGALDPRGDWLRRAVNEPPLPKTNTIIITHFPNIHAAFGQTVSNVADGEALIFQPDGKGATSLVARVPIESWPRLAEQK